MTASLLLTAHGSRDPATAPALERLRSAVAERLPDVTVELAWIEFGTPSISAALVRAEQRGVPPVIVPLLLARGTHLVRDLPHGTHVTPPLGPDARLTQVLLDQIAQAGIGGGRPVVLAATGSRDPAGRADVETQAAWLRAARAAPVEVGYVTAEPSVTQAVSRLRDRYGEEPAIAGYFLAPGRVPAASGAVTQPLAHHPLTAEIVVERFRRQGA